MKCGECPEGRRFAAGSTYCPVYGMIIRDNHESNRQGCEALGNQGGRQRQETGHREDGGGAADPVPRVVPGSGERADVFGVEEWPEE